VKIQWTANASNDLIRLHSFLAPVAPEAAATVAQSLSRAPLRLIEFSRIGERLEAYSPREVRRIIVGHYEIRYELAENSIIILRLWHMRELRPFEPELPI